MLYRLAVDTGKFEIIKDSVGGLTDDRRLQAMFIAFSFGAFIEGAAASARRWPCRARCSPGLGFNPVLRRRHLPAGQHRAGGVRVDWHPGHDARERHRLPVMPLSAMVGRLCAMISVIIPGYLIVVMAGSRRALEVLPAIVACGLSFAGMQFFVSNYMGPELTDILSSLTCIVVMVAVLKLWRPKTIMRLEGDKPVTAAVHEAHRPARSSWRGCPYLLLVVFVLAWGEPSIKLAIDRWTHSLLPSFLPTERRRC